MTRRLLPLLALLAVAYATFSVLRTHPRRNPSDPPTPPPVSPFEHRLAAVGLLESSSENVAIGTDIPGVVAKVFVAAGAAVQAGEPLFQIDDRHLVAELGVRQAALSVAEARLATAQTALDDARDQYQRAEALRNSQVNSTDEYARRDFARRSAESRLREAQAEVASARALIHATETDIARSVIRSPLEASVLQVRIRAGEFAPSGQTPQPLITLGRMRPFHLRVDIDEHAAWRFRAEAPAVAQLRGNPGITLPLKFVRLEPLVIPKRSLTGDATERVDTRVLQVLYAVEPGTVPLYLGQQMEVFIEAKPGDVPPTRTASSETK